MHASQMVDKVPVSGALSTFLCAHEIGFQTQALHVKLL